jgi:TIGR03790 family protein
MSWRGVALFVVWAGALLGAEDLASRVVLLANRDDRDSVRVAEHYAKVRGVPRENIVALPMSRAETITWNEFITTIWEPLMAELVRREWIDAIGMELKDAIGRTKYAVSGHRISYLVVCRGVPLRVMHDPQHYAEAKPLTDRKIFRTNEGAVDAELALLVKPNYPVNAFVQNPLFRAERRTETELNQLVKVTRLDGPSFDQVKAMIDQAVSVERTGLLGRAYVDLGGPHANGDRWMEAVAKQLEELGFDVDVDRGRGTIPTSARFDSPVLYFGWYSGRAEGPLTLPGFRFPPGAVAMHIHSFSAATLRSNDRNWAGPLLARGAAATVGNVFEPYLELTHRPDYLLRALVRGENFGDAAYYALPVVSWQCIAVGDPLYRPFAVSFEKQWKGRAKLPLRLGGHVVVRRMMELEREGKAEEALAVARAAQRERPSVTVGVALAQRLQEAGDTRAAAEALGFFPHLDNYPTDEWALAQQVAELLSACGKPADGVRVYRNLLRTRSMPRNLRKRWLPNAIEMAIAAQDNRQAEAWRKELAAINDEILREKNK